MSPGRLASSSLLAAGVLLAGVAHATTVRQLDTRSLTLESSDIVIGTVESSHSSWNPNRTKILTEITFRVSRTLKGEPGEQLRLTQLGGEVDGVRTTVPGCPVFRNGEEALLFVWRDRTGRAQVNGLAQGKFEIDREQGTGELLVQRRAPGLAVKDVRRLALVQSGQPAPKLKLADLVQEIERTLETGAGR